MRPIRVIPSILPTGRNCGFRDRPIVVWEVVGMTMQLEFTPAIEEALNERVIPRLCRGTRRV
jgi:hypothetical protein